MEPPKKLRAAKEKLEQAKLDNLEKYSRLLTNILHPQQSKQGESSCEA
ncbi:MAG: hypothetical protein QM500_15970 [Methylococcales bacterium]